MSTKRAGTSPLRYTTGGGVVCHADRVLLLDRPQRGEVRLPKGHIDPGETPRETALRETAEETGYAGLEIVQNLGVAEVGFRYRGRDYLRTEHYYLMRLTSCERGPQPDVDARQFRPLWCAMEEAATRLTYEAERTVVRAAIQAWRAREAEASEGQS